MELTRLEKTAEMGWEAEGLRFCLVRHPRMKHWCGYCIFPKRPLIEEGYNGIATYVPVHGGITLAEEEKDGQMIYGFDCAHAGDEDNPQLQDMAWLQAECQRMAVGIMTAAGVEEDYLLARTDEEKTVVISRYHAAMEALGIEFNLSDNFGAMIHALFGNL